jgi:hypothetical protein
MKESCLVAKRGEKEKGEKESGVKELILEL